MTHFILNWLVVSVAVWISAMIVPGVRLKGFGSAVIVAGIFGLLNFALGWLLFTVFR
ncbi:MAG: phage holin family protein [bacterium]